MIWLTWRQFRAQAVTMGAALAVLALLLLVTGPGLADDYDSGIATCTAQGDCPAFTEQFFNDHQPMFFALMAVVLFLPALVGLFWGAPLITRELEAGTHRMVWNQSVTRTRWLAVKLGLTGLAAMAAAGLATLLVAWWSGPIDKVATKDFPRVGPMLFDVRGVVPIGYAVFAFALGVTVGMLVRRTLPAMAITLAAFIAVQVAMPLLVRPYLDPSRATIDITAESMESFTFSNPTDPVKVTVDLPDTGAWILDDQTVDAAGKAAVGLPSSLVTGACAPTGDMSGPSQACFNEIKRLGYRQQVTYQPTSRFWPLQWIEVGIYLTLTFALAGLCFWWVRRRVS